MSRRGAQPLLLETSGDEQRDQINAHLRESLAGKVRLHRVLLIVFCGEIILHRSAANEGEDFAKRALQKLRLLSRHGRSIPGFHDQLLLHAMQKSEMAPIGSPLDGATNFSAVAKAHSTFPSSRVKGATVVKVYVNPVSRFFSPSIVP